MEIKTLMVTSAPAPSVLVLQPKDHPTGPGVYRIVPIWVGNTEAAQLSFALNKTKLARPLSHDLMLDAITNLDACVDHVLISGFSRSTFYSRLVLRQHGRLIELDARPSDSLALAIRQNADILIEESVLESASFPYIVRKGTETQDEELEKFHHFIEQITPEDFRE